MMTSNKPAAGNAGIVSRLTIEHHWPGVPEPGRSASMRFLVPTILLSLLAAACQPGARLGDLSRVASAERDEAQNNWQRAQKAFQDEDHRALEELCGRTVLILVDASGSPWTGRALSVEERAMSERDAVRLAAVRGEYANQIAREIRERRDRAWQVDCKIDFTRKQVSDHFIWPDAVFTSQFEVLGVLTEASISGHSVRVKPVAIPPMILQL